MMNYWIYWFCYQKILINIFFIASTKGILPEASQEGMLHPYKSYADITLFHYTVPEEVTRATWEFAAFMDDPKCPVKQVHIYIQHGSYPVMSPENSTFPPNVYTGRTALHYITTKSAYQPHDATIFPVYSPLPGNWFAAAYISNWDQHVQQEGIGHKCHYSLGSVALWSQVTGIPVISPGLIKNILSLENLSYYKVYIPSGTWHFTLIISDCTFQVSQFAYQNESLICIQSVSLKAKVLPIYSSKQTLGNITENSDFSYTVIEPYTDVYYYILIVSESVVSFNILVNTKECNIQSLGKSLAKQFAQMASIYNKTIIIKQSNNTLKSELSSTVHTLNRTCRWDESQNDDIDESLIERDLDPCLPIFRLTRIKHAQDFADTFLLQEPEWYTTWIALSDFLPVVIQLEILSFVDIGGTLSISIHLDDLLINTTYHLITVTGCIRKGRAPSRHRRYIECSHDLMLNVSSENLTTLDANKLIPYPEPDMWFIAFQAKCYFNGELVPCVVDEVMLSIDIRTQPCLFTGQPCGFKGVCQETHKGLFFFTTCTCLGGYKGWGCTDGSNATSEKYLLLTTLLLTLSNIFFLPAILLALRRNLLTEALVYMATMVFSTFYHACDQDFYTYCVTKYEVLQFCDFFCSILAFWVTLIAIAGVPPTTASTLHMMGVIIIAVGVQYNRTGLLVFIIPFGLGVIIPVTAWSVRCCRKKSCINLQRPLLLLLLPGILLAAIGLFLFAFIETEENYKYVHSAWHIVIALSLVFLLPKKTMKQPENLGSAATESSELFDVNDYYSSSPVFVVTSDLDNLITT